MNDSALGLSQSVLLSLPRQESLFRTARRRIVSIPLFLFALAGALAISPLVVLIGLPVDLIFRRRLATLRAWAMVDVFFLCEVAGVATSAWIWIRHRNRSSFLDANYRLEFWWAGTLYRMGTRLFSLKMEVEGAEVAANGPVLVFSRHVSPIDNLLPVALISLPFQSRLRWVINRSLLRDPCIDIVGNRLPNCFVANNSGDSEKEIRRVEAMGRNLGSSDGVLIFPEGGLFSPQRRERVVARLKANGDAKLAERAERLRNLLPPRLGGSMALLAAAAGVDAVFLAHTGLEGSTEYKSILGGDIVGRTIRVKMWRVPAAEIPTGYDARVDWLFEQWEAMDRWVTQNLQVPGVHHA
ncbi:MAG: 1-acyl-sn-glycerol-3-phosphate acyltransferase [bacterium]